MARSLAVAALLVALSGVANAQVAPVTASISAFGDGEATIAFDGTNTDADNYEVTADPVTWYPDPASAVPIMGFVSASLTSTNDFIGAGGSSTVLNATLWNSTVAGTFSKCPWQTTTTAGCKTTAPSFSVASNQVTFVMPTGARADISYFINTYNAGTRTFTADMINGIALLEAKRNNADYFISTSEDTVFLMTYVNAIGSGTAGYWYGLSGMIFYDMDNVKQRPRWMMKVGTYTYGYWSGASSTTYAAYGLYEYPYCYYYYYYYCYANLYTYYLNPGTIPSSASPLTISVRRKAVAKSWEFSYAFGTAAPTSFGTVGDASIIDGYYFLGGPYSVSAPNSGYLYAMDLTKLRVALYAENYQTSGATASVTFSRFQAWKAKDFIAQAYGGLRNAITAAEVSAGTRCGQHNQVKFTVDRLTACPNSPTTWACSVKATGLLNGLNYTMSLRSIKLGVLSTGSRTAGVVRPLPTLPVGGARLFLDAKSLPSWAGSTNVPTNMQTWWQDVSGNDYMFSHTKGGAATGTFMPWTTAKPYQSMMFPNNGARYTLDDLMGDREAEFELKFPNQPGYIQGVNDMAMTVFMLYKPEQPLYYYDYKVVWSKGAYWPYSDGYLYWQQFYTYSYVNQNYLYSQSFGFGVLTCSQEEGQVIGQRYSNRVPYTAVMGPNPHASAPGPTLVTLTQYKNTTNTNNRDNTYRLDACEGVQRGDITTDRCSYSAGVGADPWTTAVSPQGWYDPGFTHNQGPPFNVFNWTKSTAYYYGAPAARPYVKDFYPIIGTGVPFSIGTQYFSYYWSPDYVYNGNYYNGQLMALLMYRKELTQAERRSVQQWLLSRYEQGCPAIPRPQGAMNGCSAAVNGEQCTLSCDSAGVLTGGVPQERNAGAALLTCRNGQWTGKLPVCSATCPPRASPREYATCTQYYSRMEFSDTTYFTPGQKFSDISRLDSVPVMPWSTVDKVWDIQSTGVGTAALIGDAPRASSCDPARPGTGVWSLAESSPGWMDKVLPGHSLTASAKIRLFSSTSQAGVMLRVTNGQDGYQFLIGGGPRNMTIRKVLNGVATILADNTRNFRQLPQADWSFGGLSATAYTVSLTAVRVSLADLSQILIATVDAGTGPVILFNITDNRNMLTTGPGGVSVSNGKAAFDNFRSTGECDNNGAACRLYAGQGCSWTCGTGTRPFMGTTLVSAGTEYVQSCGFNGTIPLSKDADFFDCRPLPPIFPVVQLNISEAAIASTTVGYVKATPLGPKQRVLYYMFPEGNTAILYNRRRVPVGSASDIFRVGICSGEVALNVMGALNFDFKPRFDVIISACTNGDKTACTNTTFRIDILNAPSAPYFDLDPVSGLEAPWTRTVRENSPIRTLVTPAITATSPENSPIIYDITFGNTNNMFAINSTTGMLSVNNANLNFEEAPSYSLIVRARDAVFADLSESLLVNVNLIDVNDAPAGPPVQTLFISETFATVGTPLGFIDVKDEDAGDSVTVRWVGAAPAQFKLDRGVDGRTVVNLTRTLIYDPETAPILAHRGQSVREVFFLRVNASDTRGAFTLLDLELAIGVNVTNNAQPLASSVTPPGVDGFKTGGFETFTVKGTAFRAITNRFNSIVNVSFVSQVSDPWPGRAYNATNCRVVDDTTITCTSPAGWGADLQASITYGRTRRSMASATPMFVSYKKPTVVLLAGGLAQLASKLALDTKGGQKLLVTGYDMGLQRDAARVVAIEFGDFIPGTDRREYSAPYVPCNYSTYEYWYNSLGTQANLVNSQSRICILTPPGIGFNHTFHLRVGNQISNPSVASDTLWYNPPTISRVWKPTNLAGDAPLRWDNTANAGNYDVKGGELVYFNGTGFGPMRSVPDVTFNVQGRVVSHDGLTFSTNFNFSALRCWKPDDTQADSLVACVAPAGVSYGLRLRLQVGNRALVVSTWPPSISYFTPAITAVSGAGAVNADTQGGQQIVVTGTNLGPLESKFLTLTNSITYAPIQLSYGPVTGNEYVGRGCRVTSETPNQVTCLTAPGVGKGFLYRISVGGQLGTLRVNANGYAPPLVSSITRVPGEPVDPELSMVPTAAEYKTTGGETVVISGKNFGPCPAGSSLPCALPLDVNFNAQYYVQLKDGKSEVGRSLGDGAARLWFTAQSCVMTQEHLEIRCQTAIGAGNDAVFRVTIANQTSVLPTTGFAIPSISGLQVRSAVTSQLGSEASTDGGEELFISGANFGPQVNCRVVQSVRKCQGLIQAITYGATGTEYKVADWYIPDSASTNHDMVIAKLAPGIGRAQKVYIKVAGQLSLLSDVTFDYAAPSIAVITPNSGITNPLALAPISITLKGNNFGLLNPQTQLFVMFGNPEDNTLNDAVPIVTAYPNRANATEVAVFMATPAAQRQEVITFHLPSGAGKRRAVRLIVSRNQDVNTAPVMSAPAFFSYLEPSVDAVVVEAVSVYLPGASGTTAEDYTAEFKQAVAVFGTDGALTARKLTLMGRNFGPAPYGVQQRLVEWTDLSEDPSDPDAVWSSSGLSVFKWTGSSVTVISTITKAWLRARVVGMEFDLRDEMLQTVPVASLSNAYPFSDLSPSVGNLVGTPGPFDTRGGSIIAFEVRNLLSMINSLNVTVGTRPCPLVYKTGDSRGTGRVPLNKLRDHLVLNQNPAGMAYYSGATPTPDSTWTLYCELPEGEGSAAPLVVVRDDVPSASEGSLTIRYSAPAITSWSVYRTDIAGGSWQPVTYVNGGNQKVQLQTPGNKVRVYGTNFGLCPHVMAGSSRIFTDATIASTGKLCSATYNVQAGSTGGHTFLEFTVPEGEGVAMFFSVVAADQDSLSEGAQPIGFEYIPPSITFITPEGRTAGGDTITIQGANFGISPPTVTIGGLPCAPVVRPVGLPGHSQVTCTLSEGSGSRLAVALTVANAPAAVLPTGFSYSKPVISNVIINGTDFATSNYSYVGGATNGLYMVTLRGDNFGAFDYNQHCLFVAWRGRDRSRAFTCDGQESWNGEGEIPLFALREAAVNGVIQWTHTEVSFLFPPGMGARDVIVHVKDQHQVRPTIFRYDPPAIVGELEPNHGPTDGGTELIISGRNLGLPVQDTTDELVRQNLFPQALPNTTEEYRTFLPTPQAAVIIRFAKGCVSNYRNTLGQLPSYLKEKACEPGVRFHDHGRMEFPSAGGIGVNRTVKVVVMDLEPDANDPSINAVVETESNFVYFTYDKPSVTYTTPRPVLMDGTDRKLVTLSGKNFGTLALADAQGWTAAERTVDVTVGTFPAMSADRVVKRGVDLIDVFLPNMPVGYHNMTYTVATQVGFTNYSDAGAIMLGCRPGPVINWKTAANGPNGGFFGRPGEFCAPCPYGAVCPGFDSDVRNSAEARADGGAHMYPIPVYGFYNLNTTDSLSNGMADACPEEIRNQYPGRLDVCVVPCDPPEACLGANICAEAYVSKEPMYRCASCAKGFYKRANECVKCPDSPWALVIGFIVLVLFGGGIAYWLNKSKVNIAYIAIAIDYFQVLAIFALSKVAWPPAIKELFHVLSAFNLNIEIVAPECIVPDLGFQRKWSFIMALPFSLQIFFALLTFGFAAYRKYIKGHKIRMVDQGGAMAASVLMVMYVMYIYLTRNILDVFNCRALDPPDGKKYLSAVFEECGVKGGTQMTLMPAAVIAVIVYIIGYPGSIAYLLWKHRETAMEDQLLRAKGMGDDRITNPHAYTFRKRWARLYYAFRPDCIFWILVILVRKFCIAATYILFNSQPSFQLAACFLIIFLSYSAQMRFNPYMSPQDFEATLKDHELKSFTDPVHARLRAALSGVTSRSKKGNRKNVMSAEGKIDARALLGVLGNWLFNYNTVEQIMLFSAGTVCLMGLMFAAQNRRKAYYAESRDAITAVVIAVVVVSIIYLAVVFVTEVFVLTGEKNRKKIASKSSGKSASDAEGKPMKKQMSTTEFEVGDVSSATNPMFLGAKSPGGASAGSAASADADVTGEQTVEGVETASVIASMRDPPGTRELWRIYKSSYEELAARVDMLQRQTENVSEGVKAFMQSQRGADE